MIFESVFIKISIPITIVVGIIKYIYYKYKPQFKITLILISHNNNFLASNICFHIQNNTNRIVNIKRLKLTYTIKKNKFIKYIDIKNCYLHDEKSPYNKDDYYHLQPNMILQVKFYYTKSNKILEVTQDNHLNITEANNETYIDAKSLAMLSYLSAKKISGFQKKQSKYNYVATSLNSLIIENISSNITKYYNLNNSVKYLVYDIKNLRLLAISGIHIYDIETLDLCYDNNFINEIYLNTLNKEDYRIFFLDNYNSPIYQSTHVLITANNKKIILQQINS